MPIKVPFAAATELRESAPTPRLLGRSASEPRPAERTVQRTTVVPPNEWRDPAGRARSSRRMEACHEIEPVPRCPWNADYL